MIIQSKEALHFWQKQISYNIEARYDIFEESILVYIEMKMNLSHVLISRIKWNLYLQFLKVFLSLFILCNLLKEQIKFKNHSI